MITTKTADLLLARALEAEAIATALYEAGHREAYCAGAALARDMEAYARAATSTSSEADQ